MITVILVQWFERRGGGWLCGNVEPGAGATAGTPTISSVRINLGSVDLDEGCMCCMAWW
jgi:hypothetical protein